jgi:AhpC/TSA antioxidant enzyme
MISAAVQRLACLLLVVLAAGGFGGVVDAFQPLRGVHVRAATDGSDVDVGKWMEGETCLVVFGTYAADFNAIEYAQRLRYYLPQLARAPTHPIEKCAFVVNGQPSAATALARLVDLPDSVEVWVDNEGRAGREFGVSRGWLPDSTDVNPFLKLFGMLWGLGAWATLPAVIGGYLGNPFQGQPWIADALEVGQRMGRWPDTALDLAEDGSVTNKFDALPLVGSWPRRPLELATLRLQSMLGISLKNWDELAPDQAALDAGVLTQLGGCLVVDSTGEVLYEWKDPGICAVANFEDILKKL